MGVRHSVFLFRGDLGPLVLRGYFVALVMFAFFRLLLTSVLRPTSPYERRRSLFVDQVQLILRRVPSNRSNSGSLFVVMSRVVVSSLLFVAQERRGRYRLVTSTFVRNPITLLRTRRSVLRGCSILPYLVRGLMSTIKQVPSVGVPSYVNECRVPYDTRVSRMLG